MRLRLLVLCLAVSGLVHAAPASAQNREPHTGSFAIGGDLGFYVPDEKFHTGFTPAGFVEFYIGPRISIRVLEGWSRNQFVDMSDHYLEQFRTSFNVVWNWEHEYWHPFVTAGGGFHTVRTWVDDATHMSWDARAAFNVGAGVEYFARPKVAFKVEGTYISVPHRDTATEASGFVVSAGIKKYL